MIFLRNLKVFLHNGSQWDPVLLGQKQKVIKVWNSMRMSK